MIISEVQQKSILYKCIISKASIGNYKGVMLCSRPNEDLYIQKDKPFVSRVDPKTQIGVNPIKKIYDLATKSGFRNIMQRHREWLNEFKEKVKQRRMEEGLVDQKAQEKFLKIREMAANDRVKTKELKKEFQEMRGKILADLGESLKPTKQGKLTAENLEKLNDDLEKKEYIKEEEEKIKVDEGAELSKKKEKKQKTKKEKEKERPKWAYTEKELKEEDEKECDELLEFAKGLDYESYLADMEIKALVQSLKTRIEEIKTNKNEYVLNDLNNNKEEKQDEKVDNYIKKKDPDQTLNQEVSINAKLKKEKDEVYTQTSHKSKKSIQSIRNDVEKKIQNQNKDDWDKYSVSQSKRESNLEDRIAKQVADEILATYKPLKQIHSNNSIRKILENEAKKQLEKAGPVIALNKETDKNIQKIDASNLPYLHRNPAI